MKKLTAIILATAMLFAFASCSESDNNDPSTQSTEQTTAVPETAKAPEKAEYLEANDEDFKRLCEDIQDVMMNVPNHTPVFGEYEDPHEFAEKVRENTSSDIYKDAYFYNSASDTALADAMYMMWHTGMGLFGNFDIDVEHERFYKYSYVDQNGEPAEFPADPQNKFTDDTGYIKINADQFDSVLRNVLCVEPDRTKSSDDFDYSEAEGECEFYYQDGYYYYKFDEGGGGDDLPEIIDYSQQPDGSYIVKMSTYDEYEKTDYITGEPDEDYVYRIYEVSATLKEVDGKRIWAVSYVKLDKYVPNVR